MHLTVEFDNDSTIDDAVTDRNSFSYTLNKITTTFL